MATIFDCYDNAGTSCAPGTTTLNLDTTRVDQPSGSASPFSLSSDVLTINETGYFHFVYRTAMEYASGSQSSLDAITLFLEIDTGSGYSKIDGSDVRLRAGVSNATEVTSSGMVAYSVTSGDKFRLRVTGVQRHHNQAGCGRANIGFDVLVAVVGPDRDPLAARDPQRVEHPAEPTDAAPELGVGVADVAADGGHAVRAEADRMVQGIGEGVHGRVPPAPTSDCRPG